MNKREFIYIAIILTLAICVRKGCTESERASTTATLLASTQDTLKKERNNLGQEKATTTLLYGSVKDLKSVHVSDSTALGKLQKIVDKLTISATYLSNVTSNVVSGSTVVSIHDTVYNNGTAYVFPTYKYSFKDKWQVISTIANKDSTHVAYKVYNEFELTQKWERSKWYKRKQPVASILNLNPHTETKEMKTFTVKEDNGSRWRDAITGALIGSLLVEGLHVFKVSIPIKLF